jgi:hypothetical protein
MPLGSAMKHYFLPVVSGLTTLLSLVGGVMTIAAESVILGRTTCILSACKVSELSETFLSFCELQEQVTTIMMTNAIEVIVNVFITMELNFQSSMA